MVVIPQTSYLIAVRAVEPLGPFWEAMGDHRTQMNRIFRQFEVAALSIWSPLDTPFSMPWRLSLAPALRASAISARTPGVTERICASSCAPWTQRIRIPPTFPS